MTTVCWQGLERHAPHRAPCPAPGELWAHGRCPDPHRSNNPVCNHVLGKPARLEAESPGESRSQSSPASRRPGGSGSVPGEHRRHTQARGPRVGRGPPGGEPHCPACWASLERRGSSLSLGDGSQTASRAHATFWSRLLWFLSTARWCCLRNRCVPSPKSQEVNLKPCVPCGSGGRDPTCSEERQVPPLGREDPLGKGLAPHSSILAWEIPWIEQPCGLQPVGSQSRT